MQGVSKYIAKWLIEVLSKMLANFILIVAGLLLRAVYTLF
jgi:hypothetical protein